MANDTSFTRRGLLELGGSAVAAAGLTGLAAGDESAQVRVNVGYSDPTGRRAALAAADEVVYEFGFDALTVQVSPEARDRLAARSDVRYAERDRRMHAIGLFDPFDGGILGGEGSQGNGPGVGTTQQTCQTGGQPYPWGIDRVDADVAHENCETGNGADVAVIDTGIDRTHLDLNVGDGATLIGGTVTKDIAPPPGGQDDNGHGTHVAGSAAAVDNGLGVVGVAPDATLHPVKVLTAAGVGLTSDVAAGVEHTADQGWKVANLSLGGPESDVLKDAVSYAHGKGVLLVAAAGNDGPCSDCVTYPAAYSEVIAVSATTEGDDLAGFSSTGPEVELAAPGDDIFSTFVGNTYAYLDGTSMASPHVAGAGAQLMANGYSNTNARSQLDSTAERLSGLSSNEQGNGLVDVAAALGLDSSDN